MKNLLPFVLVLLFSHNKTLTICYAVVNLLFLFSTEKLLGVKPHSPFGLVGSNGLFAIWLFHNQVALAICAKTLSSFWWAQMDSDHRPHAYQACALTS